MKLEGIRVLDLSAFLPGPHLTMTMADHGADVIMVEPANGVGEPTRELGFRTADDVSVWFRNIARGKRSLKIDLKNEEAHALFLKLVETADVLIEAFRPGVAKRLGIDFETLAKVNPRLVFCSISAFGQTGPLRDKPAHDLVVQGLAGTVDLGRGIEDGKPALPNLVASDAVSSLMALSGILMALLRREKTGKGDFIDLSMYDALLAWTPNITGPVFAENKHPEPKTMRNYGGAAMNNIYETSDGEQIILGGSEVKFASNLLTALGREDLLPLAKEEPGPVQKPLIDFFKNTFATKTKAEWEVFLETVDLCWSPVNSLKDAFEAPHTMDRQMRLADVAGNTHIGVPIKFAHEPAAPNLVIPDYGQHSEEIASEVETDSALVARLRRSGAL